MREIKFRGYPTAHVKKYPASKDILPMYYLEFPADMTGVNWWDEFDGKPRNVKSHANQEWVNELTLMQYTGTKDKNGVEIYEGDIITHSNDGMKGVVVWNPASYRYSIDSLDGSEYIAELSDYDFEPEVLGNIYENKELLNGR